MQICPGQHGRGLQNSPVTEQDTAASAVGTKIEVTIGSAIAAMPIFRITALRDARICSCLFCLTSNPAFDSLRKVSQTNSSSTGLFDSCARVSVISATVFSPSQSFQTSAAVRFKQCALWFPLWYTSVSSKTSTTMPCLWMGTKSDPRCFMVGPWNRFLGLVIPD
jgi:hypothetical protein